MLVPIFDVNSVLSIGDVAADPMYYNTIYVGTREANTSSYSYPGEGIYTHTERTFQLLESNIKKRR